MAKQSGYLKRKKVEIGVYRQAEKGTYIQFMSDMFQIALNDPDVMGKDVLGEATSTGREPTSGGCIKSMAPPS